MIQYDRGMKSILVVLLCAVSGVVQAINPPEVLLVGNDKPYKTIQSALTAAKKDSRLTVIRIFPGTYREKINIPKNFGPLLLQGSNPDTTTIVWNDPANAKGPDGKDLGTFATPTMLVDSDDFVAEGITISNDFGVGSQAVALCLNGDRAVLRNCHLTAMQDTLLVQKKRSYFEKCLISGHVDFIFGDGAAWFEKCEIRSRGKGYLTAASTPQDQPYGYIFHQCRLTSETPDQPTYLGRPWRPYAAVTFLECEMGAYIRPEGWENWRNPENEKTARYAEWHNSGPGADRSKRVAWCQELSDPVARGLRPWSVLKKWDPNAVLTPDRLMSLPEADQKNWWTYLDRSDAAKTNDQKVLREEMTAAGISKTIQPPHGGKPPKANQDAAFLRSKEGQQLVDTVISFQTPAGGWSKNLSYDQGPRVKGMHWSYQGEGDFPWHYVGTIDNGAVTSEIRFLAHATALTKNKDAAEAVKRGLKYLFSAQYPSGGWPQVWPLEPGYHESVTYNDDAMTHVLELFDDVVAGKGDFQWLPKETRDEAASRASAGVKYILASQYKRNGEPTVWCAQHDPISLLPTGARMQEPASLSSYESATLVEYLMKLPKQTPEVVKAIQGALKWFENSKVTGIRHETRDGRNFYAEGIPDTQPWWGRFYDLERNVPIFSGVKDAKIYDKFADLYATNPTEYQYYTTKGRTLLDIDAANWKKRAGSTQ
jgi:PelA/Pel-15E family pectate lyase